jgi:pre-mRNA-processing factor 6
MSRKPAQYIPGLGRGAIGFTTRSDVGPAAPSSSGTTPATDSFVGSRAAEARVALKQQQQQQGIFGSAPDNYVPGAGRGAGRLSKEGDDGGPVGAYDPFTGYGTAPAAADGQFDEDDDEADRVWEAIDERMNSKRRKRKLVDNEDYYDDENGGGSRSNRAVAASNIGAQFRELKEKLAEVSEDQWASIPDVGDHSLKYKQQRRQQDYITPLTDSLLEQRTKHNKDGSKIASSTSVNTNVVDGISTTTNMAGLSAARNTVLGMSLDRMSDSVSGQTNVDPTGYLTSLSSTKIATSAEIGDITKARLLLKSVRETNPGHSPGWIAAARVEEAAGKILQARKLIQEGCEICPDSEDVWLEAARLHPHDVGKSILATAVRRIPHSVKLFLKAADMEHSEIAKRSVIRKALEVNPTSITLWKAAIELEDADDARILLAVAVEKVPHSVEMWLALARLETYENARKVLNKARKALPADRAIWIAAAKLEESQLGNTTGSDDKCEDKSASKNAVIVKTINIVIERAVKSLAKQNADVSRAQWLQEAETAEHSGAPLTSAAIVRHTIGKDVEPEDRQRTWTEDAKSSMSRTCIATARAIIEHCLSTFPTKRSFWMLAVDIETKYGTAKTLDEVLAAASQRLPRLEIFWLLRAKEKWIAGHVDEARAILTEAFAANPDSEAVWLAAAKLEWENSEIERARVLLQRARERAATDRVYMKSALLEREQKRFGEALQLIEEGISLYPNFSKLYMMGGQICSDDLPKQKTSLERARKFYQRGLENRPDNHILWILASQLEERSAQYEPESTDLTKRSGAAGVTKARSLLEVARLHNPKSPLLWLEAIRLERRAGNTKLAETLMAKALQVCPAAGVLLAENIYTVTRVEKKSKSADAIKRCPDDPQVIAAVATLFASERKVDKARKWFDRAVVLDPDYGDSWVRYYAFELETGKVEEQEKIMTRFLATEPKHGDLWTNVVKDMINRRKSLSDCLQIAAQNLLVNKRANT